MAALVFIGATIARSQDSQILFDPNGNELLQTASTTAPPQIIGQPQNRMVAPGDSASFFVVVKDTRALAYQWRFNGADISGGTNDAVLLQNVGTNHEGEYRVVLTNPSGSVTSAPAKLWLDDDADSMPDAWETANFGSLVNSASTDFDGDGVSNLHEFQDDTSPTNSLSARYRIHLFAEGTVLKSPDQASYTNGEVVTLTAIASPGAEPFHAWLGDIVTRSNPITLVMTNDKTVNARFSPIVFVWTNQVSGDWSVAANWLPSLIPGSNDSVVIPNNSTVTLNSSADCHDVIFGGISGSPTLNGGGTLTVRGQMSWSSGTMSGNGRTRIEPGGSLTVISAGGVSLSGRTLENGGTTLWMGAGNINLFANATITNRPGGFFHAQNAANFSVSGGSSIGRFDNAGVFLKSGNTGTTATGIGISFNNAGIVDVQSGGLDLGNGGTHAGSFTISEAAKLIWSGGTHNATGSSSILGAGQFTVSASTANFAGLVNVSGTNSFLSSLVNITGNYSATNNAVVIAAGAVNFNGSGVVTPAWLSLSGDLGGTNLVTVLDAMTWTSGNLNNAGRLIIAPGAGLEMVSPGNLNAHVLENGGTVRWIGSGTLVMNPPAMITNRPGAVFEIRSNASFVANNGLCRIDNAGTFRKSTSSGSATLPGAVALNNYGAVEIQRGILVANGGYNSTANAVLRCGIGGPAVGTGYGQLQVGIPVTLNGALVVELTSGFVPSVNDIFTLLTAASRTNIFASFAYPASAATMQLGYATNSVFVVVTAVAPPPPVLLPPEVVGSQINLTWTAVSNATYRLEYNPDLVSLTNWIALPGDVVGGSNTASKLDSLTTSNRFYRVRVVP